MIIKCLKSKFDNKCEGSNRGNRSTNVQWAYVCFAPFLLLCMDDGRYFFSYMASVRLRFPLQLVVFLLSLCISFGFRYVVSIFNFLLDFISILYLIIIFCIVWHTDIPPMRSYDLCLVREKPLKIICYRNRQKL